MGKECKRQLIWAEIRKQKENFTLDSLSSACKIGKETVETFVIGLRKSGFVKMIDRKSIFNPHVKTTFKTHYYALAKDTGIDAPRVTRDGKILPVDINQDLWRAMKILKEFSVADLMASTPQKTTESNIITYCVFLCKAKYLKRKENGRFQFARYTGAKAPQILRIKAVFDPNLKKIVYQTGGEE